MLERLLRPRVLVLVGLLAGATSLALVAGGADSPSSGTAGSPTIAPVGARSSGVAAAGDEQPAAIPDASTTSTSSSGESPPTVTPRISGPIGKHAWYIGDVDVQWETTDEETPVNSTEGCEAASVVEDTAGVEHSCTATSEGGSTTVVVRIARDATPPRDVSVAAAPAPNERGWFVAPFVATWSAVDDTSGILTCTETRYEGPDTTAGSLDGSCADVAGNRADPVAYTFRFDATAPTVRGILERAPDVNGWFNRPVEIRWDGGDDATCDEPATYAGPDAADATVRGRCVDAAGNEATGSVTLDYDATAPIVEVSSPEDNAIFLLRQPVTARYTCSDATAGVASCAGTVPTGSALDTASVGSREFEAIGRDEAGNTTRVRRTYSVRYRPAGSQCGGVAGHEILQPIRSDGSSVVNRNSTVPAKFRVCDFAGTPVTSAGVVRWFRLVEVDGATVDRAVPSTNAHESYRAGDAQWIYNISTKSFDQGKTYVFRISLDDDTTIDFRFRVR